MLQPKRAVIYARVNTETQAGDDKVSIEQQLTDCQALCESQGFEIIGIFEDKKKYTKTRSPNKGKVVESSGKYDDRPGFSAP
jgi:DNA invertase Pin-like site-specific DNA recombinase